MKLLDERVRETIFPVRIVKAFGNVKKAEMLTTPKPLQIGLKEPECTVFKNGEDGENAGVLLDFGREINGCARIMTYSCGNAGIAKARVVCGESVTEALSEIGEKNATNDHALRDFETELRPFSDMTFNETGFRFVFFELTGKNTELVIKSISAVAVYRDLPYLGTFSCNDPTLNKIYSTCAYTCHMCLQSYIWDGIKRDRLVWVGDMHPEMLTVRTVFGDIPLMAQTLEYIKNATPLPEWMNNMPAYSLWWMIIVRDWYLYTGSEEFLKENAEYILALSKQICSAVSDSGEDSLGSYFLDWPTNETAAGKYGTRALLVISLKAAEELCGYCRDENTAEVCREKAEILKKCRWDFCGAKQTAAIISLAGCCDEKKAADEILKGGAAGFSTFMSYYLLKAAAKKDMQAALRTLKEYYGAMLDSGATTFWEDFDIRWAENAAPIDRIPASGESDIHGDNGAFCYKGFRHSLCHGWSSAPAAFLADEVLGIHILSPGCETVEIKPNLGGLNWAKGTFPTPHGLITVSCEQDENGDMQVNWTAPENIKIICDFS